MGKMLVVLGSLLILIGVAMHFGVFQRLPLGRLPGDIVVKGERGTFFFPLTTCLLVSIFLSGLFHLFHKFR